MTVSHVCFFRTVRRISYCVTALETQWSILVYIEDPPAIANFLRFSKGLISEVTMGRPELARNSMDLVAASADASHGIVEHAIFGVDLVNRRTPARGVVFTQEVVKIAGEQRRYTKMT